ncbi:nuclear pore complex protein Nup214 [Drosophila grimshawi]|uniref:Nuclear pore complex protein Nup214 n=1 Tax=Drosophila grimshawi TaxID=7222 RepID=B4J4R0_DROGR|nr:nuclear pore complex protein Nup214 [Drosophila grimshawi]EDW00606.1 GH20918 [Drosophila grimshawi]
MAQNAPNCKDSQEVQFKLHDKFVAFRNCGEPRSNVKLLAVSSSRGLLFAGNPTAPELKVIIIKDVAAAKTSCKQPHARLVPLPSIPNYMSCSGDGNLLAINYTQPNGNSLLLVYAVQSFMTAELRTLYNIRLAAEDYVYAVQLLWNPVLPNSLAVVLSNGGLNMYGLREGGNFELHSLDKSQQVKCGCWSPKGKQLVLGFPSGRLQQFKPDLTPAKTLACPPNVHEAPFDTIAIHWLSTYQFAVIFLQHGEDCSPALYIINAPKAGTPTYINYYDICYSLNGPRNHQFHFTHVPQWNLLLLSSANGIEVGVLGTSEAGDTPTWQQLTLLDEARVEMPLSQATQDETFPLGFVFDTSSTHHLSLNEQQLPNMPMVHVLGTDGTLLAFNFLNLQPGATSICSPPPPLADTSGQFVPLNALLAAEEEQPTPGGGGAAAPAPSAPIAQLAPVEASTPALSDISFAFTPNTVTSTPAPLKDKPPSLFAGFGNVGNKQAPPAFGAPAAAPLNFTTCAAVVKPQPPTSFGGFGGAASTAPPATASIFSSNAPNSFTNQPASVMGCNPVQSQQAVTTAATATAAPTKNNNNSNNNKPLYTVPPTFTPVATAPASAAGAKSSEFSGRDVDDVIAEIMNVQISAFNDQIEQQKQQTKALLSQIESPSSIKYYAKRLEDLQELNEQANDVDFEQDVQGLRHALSEAYAMMAECRAKLEVYHKPDITRLMSATNFDASGRRLLSRLQSYVAANEAQLQLAQAQIDTQWEQYQDVMRRNSKSKMHMPCLEGIYQRLTRLQNVASDQRITQNRIKLRLKERGLLQSALLNQENSRARNNEAVDTLADSILSMSLHQVVDTNRAKLSQQKLQSIREQLQQHKIHIISPQRPDRVGLKSEVILETKLKAELKKKTATAAAAAAAATAAATVAKPMVAHKATQVAAAAPAPLAKPTASKPAAGVTVEKTQHSLQAPAAAPFSFSQSSPFVKTTASTVTTTTLSAGETTKPTASFFGGTTPFSFGATNKPMMPMAPIMPMAGMSAPTKPQATTAAPSAAPNLFAGFGNVAIDATKPKAMPEPAKEAPAKPLDLKKEEPTAEPVKTAPAATKAEPAGKPFTFSGFGSSAGGSIGSGSSPFSFGGFGSSLGNTAAPAFAPAPVPAVATVTAATTTSSAETVVTSSTAPAATPIFTAAAAAATTAAATTAATAAATTAAAAPPPPASLPAVSQPSSTSSSFLSAAPAASTVTSSSAPAIDNLFGSINICKPQTKDNVADAAPANIFSGFGQSAAAGDEASNKVFGIADSNSSTATTGTTTTTTPATTTPATANTVAAPATATVAAASTAASTANAAAAPGSSFSFSNAFSSLSTVSTTTGTGALTATSVAPTVSSASMFGGATNAFAPAASIGSPFQAATAAAAAAPPVAAAAANPLGGNVFGNLPKPQASVFGAVSPAAPPSGLFAAAAADTSPSPFGALAPPDTGSFGGNIFGQAAAATAAAPVKPSGFGSPAAAPAGGSIFGGAGSASASPFSGSSIFGGVNSAQSTPAAPVATSSFFGQNVFGQTPAAAGATNLFGNSSPAQPQASAFGGSIFATAAANPTSPAASGGSIFGGGSSSGGFGSFSQSSPAPGAFGSGFSQGAGSVAQSGFGSPQQQQQQSQSPAGGFGGKPVFGGSPAFGASPTFGGAPTFGSPKGFGSFNASPSGVVAPPAFGAPAKPAEGNIFETLGSNDSGLSFGNLAQTGNANAPKSSFGGSSFMTYR